MPHLGASTVVTIACSWAFTFLATLSLLMITWAWRLMAQTPRGWGLAWDDGLVVVAYFLSVSLVSLTTWAIIHEGQGEHITDVAKSNVTWIAKSLFVNEIIWSLINTCFRVSACLMLRHIFNIHLTARRLIDVIIALSILYQAVAILAPTLACQPSAKAWNPSLTGHCADEATVNACLELFGLALDICMLVLPTPILANTQLRRRRKIWLQIRFSAGYSVLVVAVLRIAASYQLRSVDLATRRGI